MLKIGTKILRLDLINDKNWSKYSTAIIVGYFDYNGKAQILPKKTTKYYALKYSNGKKGSCSLDSAIGHTPIAVLLYV